MDEWVDIDQGAGGRRTKWEGGGGTECGWESFPRLQHLATPPKMTGKRRERRQEPLAGRTADEAESVDRD